jgi:hypothetical protein
MKPLKHISLTLALFISATISVLAQPNDAGLFEAVTDTPINAGIVLMAAAGISYGLKQLGKRKL